ncbi:hypothetical protein BCR42DRAFT_496722 [Absidia repens]|uniref:Heterokaryon incompatibility domain-containing protein n=1 Tax=Absidia repens TaxID=90262 RepID=A0A1X2HYP4_9FUNG|nr:hypothetical protein BCR42DRAFT_496722 [Absidia repens]
MGNNDSINQLVESLSCNDTQPSPFHIVLVDIKKAAEEKEIVCLKRPLLSDDNDLNYVALSYRCGEYQETLIDTELGYMASVTAFRLNDFYFLCRLMTLDPDMQHIKYVWVDAICIDQTNVEHKRATLHHMSDIYHHANTFLAVPDLHLRGYLETNPFRNISPENPSAFFTTMYHVIHGHKDQVLALEAAWLEANHISTNDKASLQAIHDDYVNQKPHPVHPLINQRKRDLRYYAMFLANLIVDWSSRVWVVGECLLMASSTKKKMKYWFVQFDSAEFHTQMLSQPGFFSFFEYDFADPAAVDGFKPRLHFGQHALCPSLTSDLDTIYANFHFTMINQLSKSQTPTRSKTTLLIERMLKTNASKNEDRFYALLPVSKYKHKLITKDTVAHWHIDTMLSVKLKLFELMDTKDALVLLFLLAFTSSQQQNDHRMLLPTFATLTIEWIDIFWYPFTHELSSGINFDFKDRSTLQFMESTPTTATDHDLVRRCHHYLNIRPIEYYHAKVAPSTFSHVEKKTLGKLGMDVGDTQIDMVCIPSSAKAYMTTAVCGMTSAGPYYLFLLGSFALNQWVVKKMYYDGIVAKDKKNYTQRLCCDDYSAGFNIY